MARTEITVQNVNPNTNGIAPSFSAVDAANDMMFLNDGLTYLHVKNAGTGAVSLTVVSVPDRFGRLGDITISIPNGTDRIIGVLHPELFSQSDLKVHLNFDISTSVTIGAFRLNR